MSEQGAELSIAAKGQIAELIALLRQADDDALRRPCPGREKLGDGSVGACAEHAASNYARIAVYAVESVHAVEPANAVEPAARTRSGLRALLRRRNHGPWMHAQAGTSPVDRRRLLSELEAAAESFDQLAVLSDAQLDAVPAAGEQMRFADGKRSVAEIVGGALKHQRHQLDAIAGALSAHP